ncbi:MAG: hypothetical protein J0651_05420 [Actinobacteria bacterium]|nr:hypothetical protein [Actinomycetota bacterium]
MPLALALSAAPLKVQFPPYFRNLVESLDRRFEDMLAHKEDLDDFIQQLNASVSNMTIARLPTNYFSDPIPDCTKLFVQKLKCHLEALRRLELSPSDLVVYREGARLLKELVFSHITEESLSSSELPKQLLVLSIICQPLHEAFEGVPAKPLTREIIDAVYQEMLQAYASPCLRPTSDTVAIIRTVVESKCLRKAMQRLRLDTYCLENFASRVYVTNIVKNAYAVTTFGGLVFLNESLQQHHIYYTCLLYITIAHEAAHCSMRMHRDYYDALILTEEREVVIGCPGDSQTHTIDRQSRECGDQIEQQLFGCKVTMLTMAQCEFLITPMNWSELRLGSFQTYLHSRAQEGSPGEIRYLPKKATIGLMALREKCRYKGR